MPPETCEKAPASADNQSPAWDDATCSSASPLLYDQVAQIQTDTTDFRQSLRDTFSRIDLNGDGEIEETEISALEEEGASRVKPEFLKALKDNFSHVASAHQSRWFEDDLTISEDDFYAISLMYQSKREDELLAEGAKNYLSENFSKLSEHGINNIEQGAISWNWNLDKEGVYTKYLLSRFGTIIDLDKESLAFMPQMLRGIDRYDIAAMSTQSMSDANMAALYLRSVRFNSRDYEKHRDGLNAFIADSSKMLFGS